MSGLNRLPDELLRSVSTFAGPRASANLAATNRTAKSIFKPDAFAPYQQADVVKSALRQTLLALEDTVEALLDPYDVGRMSPQKMQCNLEAVSVLLTKFRNAYANQMGDDSWVSLEGSPLYLQLVEGTSTRESRQAWRAFVARVKEAFASLARARMDLVDEAVQQPISAIFNMGRRRASRRKTPRRKTPRRKASKRRTSKRKTPKRKKSVRR